MKLNDKVIAVLRSVGRTGNVMLWVYRATDVTDVLPDLIAALPDFEVHAIDEADLEAKLAQQVLVRHEYPAAVLPPLIVVTDRLLKGELRVLPSHTMNHFVHFTLPDLIEYTERRP